MHGLIFTCVNIYQEYVHLHCHMTRKANEHQVDKKLVYRRTVTVVILLTIAVSF
jgi:hypothetical protein